MPPMPDANVLLNHPANDLILRHLGSKLNPQPVFCSPESIADPYMTLGTHPEAVSRLWDDITLRLPVRCQWIVHGTPALVRLDSGVLFGFAAGTIYGLRLPPAEKSKLVIPAIEEVQEAADSLGMTGAKREQYLRAHQWNIQRGSEGSTFDISTLGPEWAFGRYLAEEVDWCLAAYEYAT